MRASLVPLRRAVGPILFAVAVLVAPAAHAQSNCEEKAGPGLSVKSPRELTANPSKPTLTIPLKGKTDASRDVRLPVNGDKTVGKTARAASAEIIEAPSLKDDPIDADVSVAAAPTQAGRSVTVYACVTNSDLLQAGKYEGLVEVTGTRIEPFSYAIVVTQRYPFWIPAGILAVLWLGILLAEVFRKKTPTGSKGNFIVAALAAFLLAGTYFGQYVYNDTWGDNLGEQITALLAAGGTAVAAARAAATKFAAS
jgi:hypothetical protein